MRASLLTILVALAIPLAAASEPDAPKSFSHDVDRAVAQFRDFFANSPDAHGMRDTNEARPSPDQALRFAAELGADGRWSDIDYESKARSGWPPAQHWQRIQAMATVYARTGTGAADRATLLAAVHRAFGHWIVRDYLCTNWWFNQIGVPKIVGATLLLLGDAATPEEFHYGTQVSLARYPIKLTGQNKIWLAGNTLMRGLLLRDETLIRAGIDAIWDEIEITTKEGLQPDFSFHQHGAQQQFGNYGLAYAVNMAIWARVLDGTRWQLSPAKLDALRSYLLEGQAWISWHGAMDISACGRQLMPGSPLDKASTITRVMRQAMIFDQVRAPDYAAFVARNEAGGANTLTGFRHFWRSDYAVFRRPEFMATLKMSSNRVIGTERENQENLSGYHLGDGALYLYRRGDEYIDIFPLWNWNRVPGVTCAQTVQPEFVVSHMKSDFVGGLSKGDAGLAALDYRRDGVSAKKAWFFHRDAIVCLGADIRGQSPAGIATTLNQVHLRGPVRVIKAGRAEQFDTGERVVNGETTVEHDGWRYTIAAGSPVRIAALPAVGNWQNVYRNPTTPTDDVRGSLFTLWLDHGTEPTGASYAYTAALANASPGDAPRVLANGPSLQAAALEDGTVGVVFWTAGEFGLPDGTRLKADAPCLVLVKGMTAQVVDPTHKLARLALARDGVVREVVLPVGSAAGTPVQVDWQHTSLWQIFGAGNLEAMARVRLGDGLIMEVACGIHEKRRFRRFVFSGFFAPLALVLLP